MTINRAAVATLVLGLVVFAAYSTQSVANPKTDAPHYVLGIEGMSCPVGCVPAVTEALQSIPGVKSVEVSFDDKQAIVHMVEGRSLSKESCDQAFGNSGYFVSSFEHEPGGGS